MKHNLEKVADIFTIIVATDGFIDDVHSYADKKIAKNVFYDLILHSGQMLEEYVYTNAVKEGHFSFHRGDSLIVYHLVTQPIFKQKTLIAFDPEKF